MGQDKHMPAHSQQQERREERGKGEGGKGRGREGERKRKEEGERERGRERGGRRGRGRERRGTVGGRESSEISTHHSPVSVSGMMYFSFHDVLQTEILWDKISTSQLIHNKRKGEREERRKKGEGKGEGG